MMNHPRKMILLIACCLLPACASGPTEVVQSDGYGDYREYTVPAGKAGERYMENMPQNKPSNWNEGIMPYNPDPNPGESMIP
ncbi:hypothetical protein QQ056_16255 [Oscillatoria laete-virens NRMC-F 0139]|nr:hypothetical protein [Oscillatoria laete-virens]MDL5055090.1 hypothetical protein [Oscillatoria laete-virens NRMC-F 0139]